MGRLSGREWLIRMEENHPWDRSLEVDTPAVDVPQIREQLAGLLPRLRRFARVLARNPVEADDLVHTAVVQALTRAAQRSAQTELLTWVLSLITRAWAEDAPTRRRQQRAFIIGHETEAVSESRRELLHLQQALARLSDRERRAVALVLIEGCSYAQAADFEGVTVGTLTARLLRARRALAGHLEAPPAAERGLPELILMAYVDGQQDTTARAEVEAMLRAHASAGRWVGQLKSQLTRLRGGFDRTLEEPVPQRLLAATRSVPMLQGCNNVIPLRRRPPPPQQLSWAQVGMLGATLLTGVVLGEMLPPRDYHAMLTAGHRGGLPADRSLALALNAQLTGEQSPEQAVQIGASFRSHSGRYCRTFALRESTVRTGLACREKDGWRVRLLTENDLKLTGVALPAALSQALALELGAPLELQAEVAAREHGWQLVEGSARER